MLGFVKYYSDFYAYPINEKLIKNIRKNDNIVEYIEEACIELQKALPNIITYAGYEYDDRPNALREISADENACADTNNQYVVNIDYSYSRLAIFKFKIKFEGETRIIKMPLYIPLLYDDYHFYIRGNKYAAPYQLIDAITYAGKGDSIVLRSMTRLIEFVRKKVSIKDVHGIEYSTHEFYIKVNSKKVPFLLYYFAHFGFVKTLEYFGTEKFFKFYTSCPPEPVDEYVFFKFGKVYMAVDRIRFLNPNSQLLRQFVASILTLSKKGLDKNNISDANYWKNVLGSIMSETNSFDKGVSFLNTFITTIDHRTMRNLNLIEGGTPKKSTFGVVRWMFIKYNLLYNRSRDIYNKRLRLGEYIVAPLIKDLYTRLYRFINTTKRMRDITRVTDIFKMQKGIIQNSIIGKYKLLPLNIVRYSSYVNDMSLLNVGLKYTIAGPGTPMEKSGKFTGISFRQFTPSYMGKVCLITTSSGDSGVNGLISPFAEIDEDTLTFKKD